MKHWNIQDIIKERVNLEAEVEHAYDPRPELPKYEKPKVEPLRVGVWNLLNQLKP